jgi:hypothetical protein
VGIPGLPLSWISLTYWPAQLDIWVEILRRELSAEALTEVYPFYNWMIVNQPAFTLLSADHCRVCDPAPPMRIGLS